MSKQRQGSAALSSTSSHETDLTDEDDDANGENNDGHHPHQDHDYYANQNHDYHYHANQNHDDDDHRDTRLTISSPSLWADSPLHHQSNHLPTPLMHHHDHHF